MNPKFSEDGTTALDDYSRVKGELAAFVGRVAELPAAETAIFGSADNHQLAVRSFLQDLQQAIARDTFRVAVIGEFSTGKSSLLNVLLELHDRRGRKTDGLLPTAIVPTTCAITHLYYNPELLVEVVLNDGSSFESDPTEVKKFLSAPALWHRLVPSTHASDTQLAANTREVNIGCNAPLLARGVEILDTPGLGSVYLQHAEITRRCVATVDAVIFTISTHPPMTERDLTFLQYVANFTERFIFVQNKKDRDLAKTLWQDREQQHRRTIRQVLGHDNYPFFHVSALMAAKALRDGDARAWEDSGIPALRIFLEHFLVELSGSERLHFWLRRLRRALDLIRLQLENERDVYESRLRQIAIALPTSEDYRQWDLLRDVFDEELRDLRERARVKIDHKLPSIQNAVDRDVQRCLETCMAAEIRANPELIHRVERQIVKSIRQQIQDKLEREVQAIREEAFKALRQALADNMPPLLQRFQPKDAIESALADLSIELAVERVTKSETRYRERQAQGFWDAVVMFFRRLFGWNNLEAYVEVFFDTARLSETVNHSVQEAVDDVRCTLVAELRAIQQAGDEELERTLSAARKLEAEHRQAQQRSQEQCEARLASIRNELSQVGTLVDELDSWLADNRLMGRFSSR